MDELESLFKAEAQALRDAAPTAPPAWRIHQRARERAAARIAHRLRWTWRIATLAFIAAAIPLALHDARMVPGLVAPLLAGALLCWRDEPGVN